MRRILALAVLVLAVSVGKAQAATITFEDLALDPLGAGGDRTSGGYFFDTALNHSHIDNGTWGTSNGTQIMMIDNVALNPNNINNTVTMSPSGGGTFSLTSLDISEAGGLTGQTSTSSRQVQLTGNLLGGGTVSRLLVLDLNFVDGVTANYFQTFLLDGSWTNLSSITLTGLGAACCGGTDPARGNYYAIDNIVVTNQTPVPEPGTMSLLGLGCTYLFARRRRRLC